MKTLITGKRAVIGASLLLLLLLAASAAAAFLEEDATFSEGSAAEVVQLYVRAVADDDWESAHGLLVKGLRDSCPVESFATGLFDRGQGDERITLVNSRAIGESVLVTVNVTRSRFDGPLSSNQWSQERTYTLVNEEGQWRFSEYPEPFYSCPDRDLVIPAPPPAPAAPSP